jgi:hypothetical protein
MPIVFGTACVPDSATCSMVSPAAMYRRRAKLTEAPVNHGLYQREYLG